MNISNLTQQIKEVRQRTQALQVDYGAAPEPQNYLHKQTLDELYIALEKLHQAEEELRAQNEQLAKAKVLVEEERQRYQELFDFAPDAYLITDKNGKIIEANHTASHLLKVSKHFLKDKPFISFICSEERRAFRSQLLRLPNVEQIQEWEISLQQRQGKKIDCSINITTIRNKFGAIVGWRWLIRDITARKRTEEQLRSLQLQNLELQQAAHIKSQFVATVSHELRTPMNAILGFSQLLLRRYHHQFTPESRNMVERVIRSGKHLLTLIENILDFSKIEAGMLNLKLEEFNVADLIKATAEELRPLAEQRNLALDVHISDSDLTIVNDSDRLRQVLINLLSNAIKFTDTGGVLVEMQQLEQNRVALKVKDTGIGIAETDLQHLFKEFWQADQSTTSSSQRGTGLGLTIVDKLVRLMKGTITVESKLGHGSVFHIELPCQTSVDA